jgi:hypothetical protein
LASSLLITEFMAANEGGLRDGYDRSSDWIEIHNPLATAVDLAGYRLTDDPQQLDLWPFPSLTLDPGGYLVVLASAQTEPSPDPAGYYHTNFRLDRDGGFLALLDPQGRIVDQFGASAAERYPEQLANISYGASSADGVFWTRGYMIAATPGAPNVSPAEVLADFVRELRFSVERGFFDQPFEVALSTATPGTTIRYTTDGSAPSLDHGTAYAQPVSLSETTILRAAAFRDGYVPTRVATHSYMFLADVLTQDGSGLPETWGTFVFGSDEVPQGDPVPANYEIDPEVVNDPRYRDTFLQDLRSLPTLSLVLTPDDLWHESTGIYSNPVEEGPEWERAGSVELVDAAGVSQFQVDAGVRIHGGFGRRPSATAKHSFRLFFRGIYGATELDYPWFGDDYPSQFDTIVLRANYNYSWARGNRGGVQTGKDYTVVNDRWAAVTQTEMGGLAPRGTYVHLYVNGLYWGVYNPTERPDASFQALHRGGREEQYDVQNHEGLVAGDRTAWSDLRRAVRANPLDLAAVESQLDLDNFIHYMILNQFGGNTDWPQNNWYASRRRAEGEKWQFHSWDAEFFFVEPRVDRINSIDASGPGELFLQLLESDEFRLRFADRIQQHLFNGGVLTPERNIERLDELAAIVDRAVVGESARWGDAWMNQVDPPRTRDDDWLPRLEELRSEYFPARNALVDEQYRRRGIYPDIDAPTLSQHGGPLPPGDALSLSHADENAQIYYTTDGSDPRGPTGEIAPQATLYDGQPLSITQPQTVVARAWNGTQWSARIRAEFIPDLTGDVTQDGRLDVADIDALCQQVHRNPPDSSMDLNGDQVVDHHDHRQLIQQLLQTTAGDADLNRVFDSGDLVAVFQAGTYEDGVDRNAAWSTGDWNCDLEFDTSDLVAAFQAGSYAAASQPFTARPRLTAAAMAVADAARPSLVASQPPLAGAPSFELDQPLRRLRPRPTTADVDWLFAQHPGEVLHRVAPWPPLTGAASELEPAGGERLPTRELPSRLDIAPLSVW